MHFIITKVAFIGTDKHVAIFMHSKMHTLHTFNSLIFQIHFFFISVCLQESQFDSVIYLSESIAAYYTCCCLHTFDNIYEIKNVFLVGYFFSHLLSGENKCIVLHCAAYSPTAVTAVVMRRPHLGMDIIILCGWN